ncbi:hypothetical protein O6H91_05G014600 [Diphasiastrum complanatum]|uniref:Uncharacterized protein n=1 Tax=Diphasiastrum complanatum TaxID=34168 RepID=A0ACC2DKQ8_DIPCM|nr:hypothetical protein O6H91_05G014600 [Diphasiastrum complanatum]
MAHPTGPPSAEDVGNAFVSQYYIVLHQSPQEMHRFYTNSSWYTHAEPGGAGRTFIAQSAIHDKFMSLDYGDFKTEIKTVDSQESVDGGVLVMVTGTLIGKSSARLNFVQSFVLARQEKGYFVRNDIFRYLEEQNVIKPAPTVLNDIPEISPQIAVAPEPVFEATYPTEDEILQNDFIKESSDILDEEHIVEEVYDLPERAEISDAEDYAEQEEEIVHLESLPSPSALPAMTHAESSAPQMEEASGEVPKKSYASILRVMKENSGRTAMIQNGAKVGPVVSERAAGVATPAPSHPTLSLPLQESAEEGSIIDLEGEGRSIYVKSLPISVTASQLADEFSKFGLIKPGGINVRSMKGFCYAFVEFEDSSSAQNAIDGSPVLIGGRPAYVEEKRPLGSRGLSISAIQGRTPPGRSDRSYRNDGIGSRGRGSTNGRGLGRNAGQDRDRGVFRGRGTGTRGGYGGVANSHFANDYASSTPFDVQGRAENQGGNAARFPRRQITGNMPVTKTGSAVTAA